MQSIIRPSTWVAVLLFATLSLTAGSATAQGTLYLVVDEGSDAFYTVNTTTAAVTQIGMTGSIDASAEGLAPSPSPHTFLYSVDNSDNLDEVNIDGSGYIRITDDMGSNCDRGLAYNTETGVLYGSDSDNLCSINPATGAVTELAPTPGSDTEGLAADPVNNYVYGIDNDENLVRYDAGTDSWTTIGDTVNISDGNDIGVAYDPDSQTLYAVDNDGILYTVNTSTGEATEVGDTGLGSGLDVGLAFVAGSAAPAERATFRVRKHFTDGNTADVEVTLSCNTGLPLEQTAMISETEGVLFVVEEFDEGELDCAITEAEIPGYDVEYDTGADTSDESCAYENLEFGGRLNCVITNSPAPVDVVITKDWVFEGSTDGSGVNLDYDLTLYCENEIIDGTDLNGENDVDVIQGDDDDDDDPGDCGRFLFNQEGPQGIVVIGANWCKRFYGDGPGTDMRTAEVIPGFPESTCYVQERVYDQAIEVDNGCFDLTVSAGQGASCTVTNTVFFEGIPTLNQYGLAVLALLMLGFGVIGFRRFT
ncbi:IPTL-CTERM sorting domain-containing protein [Elongatibacter sediminis]|uniref:IPTL-CTERM sorting domain-containing protein n=1 Tax=Elongatibacter sediminis TaxID=3119006 RepID=A0AAW9RAK3_9GAMM